MACFPDDEQIWRRNHFPEGTAVQVAGMTIELNKWGIHKSSEGEKNAWGDRRKDERAMKNEYIISGSHESAATFLAHLRRQGRIGQQHVSFH